MSLKELCKSKGKTLTILADETNLSIDYLSKLNTGKRNNPSLAVLNKISESLGVTIDELQKSVGGNKQ